MVADFLSRLPQPDDKEAKTVAVVTRRQAKLQQEIKNNEEEEGDKEEAMPKEVRDAPMTKKKIRRM